MTNTSMLLETNSFRDGNLFRIELMFKLASVTLLLFFNRYSLIALKVLFVSVSPLATLLWFELLIVLL